MRPANLSMKAPGRGLVVVEAEDGTPVAVANVQGSLFMNTPVSPFEVLEPLVEEARSMARIVVVDFHGEATSEKVAAARLLDGRVTAVIGTHTHIQTNDARVQPGGTAAITDAGMTGPHDSVIGVKAELAIERMRTGMPVRFEPAERRRPDRGRARRVRRRGPGPQLRAGSGLGPLTSSTASSASSTRSRATTAQDGNAFRWSTRSQ